MVIALLMLPLIVTKRSFGHDWTLHLWLLRQQELNIQSLSHPGLFVTVRSFGVFYPIFGFVGSGLYTLGGYLAIALGDRPVLAYKLLYLGGFGIAYGGMTWLSVQLGLRSWRSQIPGLVLVTGAYFITDFVGRGDLGEFIALATIPLLLAASRAAFTSPRIHARDLLAVVGAAFLLTGSHNITLLWGTLFIACMAIVSCVAVASVGIPPIPWSRIGAVAGSGAIGAGLNAWFLFADLRYGLDTSVAEQSKNKLPKVVLTQPGLLLNPLRPSEHAASPFARDLRFSMPWMFALWAVVAAVLLWRNRDRPSKVAFAGVFGIAIVYIALIIWRAAWHALPPILYNLQYTWRLNAYLLLATAVLVLLALRWQVTAPEPVKQSTTVVLIALIVFNVGAATWQVWRVRSEYVSGPNEEVTGQTFLAQVVASRYNTPASWYTKADFRDKSTPVIATEKTRVLTVPVTAIVGSKFAGVLAVPNGPFPFRTNISAGPNFIKMTGIRAVGRSVDGTVVAVRAADVPATGPIKVTIVRAESNLLRLGDLVSITSALLLLAMILWALSSLVSGRGSRGLQRRRIAAHRG